MRESSIYRAIFASLSLRLSSLGTLLRVSTLPAMGEKKVTKMIIRGDLQCYKCSQKIKKILCEIPQIRDQVYDEKNNTVTIIVACCSPEKIRDRIYSKACSLIKSIEIVEEKPPPPPPRRTKLVPVPVLGCPPIFYPVMWYPCYFGCRGPCYHGRLPMCPHGCRRPAHECMCADGCGRPARECMCPDGCGRLARECMCSDGCGRSASECSDGCGRLAHECQDGCRRLAHECPDGCGRSAHECMCSDDCGRLVNECDGRNRGHYVNRCDYFSEENANACTIM